MNPSVSVIVPTYNSSNFIDKCIDGLLNQTLKSIEIICIDDGSRDDTLNKLTNYANIDSRVKLISQKNCGPGIARNNGFQHATGKYVFFFDSDDYLKPDCLEKMYHTAETNASEVTICRCKEMNDYGTFNMRWTIKEAFTEGKEVITPSELGTHIFQFSIGWAWDKLLLTDFLKANNISFAPYRNAEDLMMAFPAILMANKISIIEEDLIYHRTGRPGSVSNSRKKWPYCFIETTSMLRHYIETHKETDEAICSYNNWAVEYALWNMDTLPIWSKIKVYHKLRRYGIKKMKLQSIERNEIEDSNMYYRIKIMQKEPTIMFIAEMALESYNKYGIIGSLKKLGL